MIKKNFQIILLTCIFLNVIPKVIAQRVDSMLNVYYNYSPKERFHVHFDKNTYNKEETIWYKVYILDEEGLTRLSKSVYVQWFDAKGKILTQTVSPLFQATAKGSYELPSDYQGNFIRMKVFTKWALNDDSAFLFTKDIVINNDVIQVDQLPKPLSVLNVFPEGGDLVIGINSRVAYKSNNNYGKPVNIKGFLMNDKNNVLDTLKTMHDGMGSFYLNPKPAEKYFIKWTDASNVSYTTPLPAAKSQGITLSVRSTNEAALVKIERTAQVPDNFKQLTLLVHMNQLPLYSVNINASEKLITNASIPIAELNTGVVQFTLFTSDWLPVCERVMYVNNRTHEFGAKIITQLTSLNKRGKNVFDVYVSDTTETNMSVAVIDASVDTSLSYATIYSDLLLSNQIKGKIHNPGYYLSSDAETVLNHLDLVMLTHGWRRIDWEKLKKGIPPSLKYMPEMERMKISGKVYGLKMANGTDNMLMNMIVQYKDSSKNFMFQPISKDGYFENRDLFFYDTVRIYYSFNQNQKLNEVATVQFDNGLLKSNDISAVITDQEKLYTWSDSLAKSRMAYFLKLQEDWKKRSQFKTLQEVIVKSRSKPKEDAIEKQYATGMFSGGDAFVFDVMNDPAAQTGFDIFNYLQSRVPGLQISRSGINVGMTWRGATPDLFLDQMPSQVNVLQTITMQDIAMVKVFRPPFFGSIGGGAGGAIAVYTKKGSSRSSGNNSKSNKEMFSTVLGGYSRFKEFYTPAYDTGENPETDIRTTVYWNPFVITNKKSPRYRIQFFNNDLSKRLLIILEGVNADGKMTRSTKILE
jgi:hypothetical protein